VSRALLLASLLLLPGCGTPAPVPLVAAAPAPAVPDGATPVATQTVVAGCSMCMFEDKPFTGCFWAVEMGDRRYVVEGDALPQDHQSHGPEGMCTVKREATVEGWIAGDAFVATRFDLLPFEPGKHPQPAGPAH